MKRLSIIFLLSLILGSCMELGPQELAYEHKIIGTWSNIEYSEAGLSMERVSNLQENQLGYVLFSNGRLISRAISGFCGTPPIMTADYEGTWRLEDGKILVEVDYWGGRSVQEWEIVSVSTEKAIVKINHVIISD